MDQKTTEILANPAPRQLWRFVVRANNIEDAIKVIQTAHPEQKITLENIIHYTVIGPSKQLNLFNQ